MKAHVKLPRCCFQELRNRFCQKLATVVCHQDVAKSQETGFKFLQGTYTCILVLQPLFFEPLARELSQPLTAIGFFNTSSLCLPFHVCLYLLSPSLYPSLSHCWITAKVPPLALPLLELLLWFLLSLSHYWNCCFGPSSRSPTFGLLLWSLLSLSHLWIAALVPPLALWVNRFISGPWTRSSTSSVDLDHFCHCGVAKSPCKMVADAKQDSYRDRSSTTTCGHAQYFFLFMGGVAVALVVLRWHCCKSELCMDSVSLRPVGRTTSSVARL